MGDLTADRHKCLVELAGKPLLDWQLEALNLAGIMDTVLVVGYRKDELIGRSTAVVENQDWHSTNMVGSLTRASAFLRGGRCVITYADLCYHPGIVRDLLSCTGDIAVAYDTRWLDLWSERFDDPLSDAESFVQRDGHIVEIGRRTNDITEVQGQYMGLVCTTPDGWSQLELLVDRAGEDAVQSLDMTSLLAAAVAEGVVIDCVPVDGRWVEVDSAADLRLYEERIAASDRGDGPWSHDWRPSGDEVT